MLDIRMPGIDGIEAARLITEQRMAAVVILTAFSQRELIDRATDAGALGYLVKPWQRHDLVPAIEVAHARFVEQRSLLGEAASFQDQLATRKILDKAKGHLMDTEGLSEQEAFRRLQHEAMGSRRSMKAVALEVLGDGVAAD
jgi:AmiR/NasT family two-component response regulator